MKKLLHVADSVCINFVPYLLYVCFIKNVSFNLNMFQTRRGKG